MDSENNWRRSFWALIVTQFQGAFSLNAFEYLLLYMVLSTELVHNKRDQLVSIIPLFLAVPFLVFSMAGGFLADRFSKRRVTISTKLIEIAAMTIATVPWPFGPCRWNSQLCFSWPRRLHCSVLPSTVCCRKSFRRSGFPGAMGSSSWERFSPLSPA